MAVGDVVNAIQSVSAGGFLDIRPPSGQEWVIHNIYHEGPVELYYYDGTNSILFDGDSSPGVWAWYEFHCTNSVRLRVKNLASISRLIGYDGVQTK